MEKSCPLGHSPCSACLWNVRLRGQNPQTGQEVDTESCAIAILPLLMIENSNQQRQTAAAVESARNALTGTLSRAVGAIVSTIDTQVPLRVKTVSGEEMEALCEPR